MRSLILLVLSASALSVFAGCPTVILDDADAGTDGPVVISCEVPEDCPQDQPECSFGVCKRPCAANEGCIDPQTFCNSGTGYCEPGCRDSSTCDPGTVCSAGACIVSQGCATKCDCQPGQVCAGGACTDPPATCTGPDDCGRGRGDECEDFACNGFTNLCFDPDPDPCANDSDCIGRPGCAQGCTCTGNQTCAPSVACTASNEATTCGVGNYCDGFGACQVSPACTSDPECADEGLVCNEGAQRCERAVACDSAADCTTPPTTFCPTTGASAGFCAQPTCLNGGVTCGGGEQCAPDGRCVVQGTGGPCTVNSQCAETEYCAVVAGNGQCTVGCRDNSSCAPGQQCDGSHTCVGGGGDLGGFGDSCEDDSECQSGLICGIFSGTCAEPCDGTDCAVDGCCQLSGSPCCNGLGFCADEGFGGGC